MTFRLRTQLLMPSLGLTISSSAASVVSLFRKIAHDGGLPEYALLQITAHADKFPIWRAGPGPRGDPRPD
jgi:hypothetical protein